MRRAITATIAFYVGIVSILIGVISYVFGARVIGIKPMSFIHFANAWFLIAIVCLFHELLKRK